MNRSIHTRRIARAALAALTAALLSGCAAAPSAPSAARSELAPTGKLRVGLLVINPAHVSKDGAPDEMQGVGVEIGRELAKQLGVPFEPVRYKSVGPFVESAKKGEWDVAPMGYAPERTATMDFTAPFMLGASVYVVLKGSPIKTVAEVDKPGHRVIAGPKTAQEAYLRSNLKHAELMIGTGTLDVVKSGKAHAYFTPIAIAHGHVAKRPEFRVVEGSVATGGLSLAVAKGRPAGAAYAKEFIEHVKASGLVQQAIERTGLQGVSVAPAASGQ